MVIVLAFLAGALTVIVIETLAAIALYRKVNG